LGKLKNSLKDNATTVPCGNRYKVAWKCDLNGPPIWFVSLFGYDQRLTPSQVRAKDSKPVASTATAMAIFEGYDALDYVFFPNNNLDRLSLCWPALMAKPRTGLSCNHYGEARVSYSIVEFTATIPTRNDVITRHFETPFRRLFLQPARSGFS